jgi:hypothetical protein
MTSSPFDNPFGQSLDDLVRGAKKKQPEKGIPWNAKEIDGRYYVPLEQVAELLKQNDVLPAVRRGIENRNKQLAEFNARKKS